MVPVMLLSMLIGLGTIAALWVLKRRGDIRLSDPMAFTGLALALLDVILPIGLVLYLLLLLALLGKDFRIMP